jgi:acyl carrier protein phosphodiesterase
MNYLAHLYLASDKGNARIGGLLGDFVKGISKEKYSRDIQIEIQLHGLIDSYTDKHSITKMAKELVSERKRRYMGIVLDVFYDHMLASKWDKYSNVNFLEFTQNSYHLLQENKGLIPEKLGDFFLPSMINEDWLSSYKNFDGFKNAIHRISKRLSKGNILQECIADVEENYLLLSSYFDNFFPQLIDYVQKQRTTLSAQ